MSPPVWNRVLLVVGVALLVHLLLAQGLGLVDDEAYYWTWAQQLSTGYFDHPPAIAWLIGGGSALAGDTELGVRLLPVLVGAAAALFAAAASPAPVTVALLLATAPLTALGGVLATPDAPLVGGWALGLWAASGRRWGWLGVAWGLCMLGKYTGLLLVPLLLLAEPRALKTRGPYLAAGIAFLVYLPNAIWNLQHEMVSWRFQLDHVGQAGRPLEVLAAQVGLAGPVLFAAAVAWWGVGWRGSRLERLCWWTSLPLLALAVWAGGEANWAAPAWVSVIVGLSCRAGRWSRLSSVAIGANGALCGLVLLHLVHPLIDLPKDPLDRLRGGRVLAESVAAWGLKPVYASRYQEAAQIHFYAGIPAHALPGEGRPDQYDLWPMPETPAGARALFVRPWRASTTTEIERAGFQRSGPHVVGAYADTTDPLRPVAIATWQVYEVWR